MSRTKVAAPRRRNVLKRWNMLSEFIELLVWTGHVANGRPQSIFMIAEPGEGKTELLERFRHNSQLRYFSDLTYRTVIGELKDAAMGKCTHIVCTEFQKVIARRRSVSESTLAIILQAMEEGVHKVAFGPQMHDCHGARLGFLAATTVTSMSKNPYIVSELAMDSRAYFVDATATAAELEEISNRIACGDESALTPIHIRLPDHKVHVRVPEAVAQRIRLWPEEMKAKNIRTYGVRTFTRFLHTVRGVALSNGREVVHRHDEEQLYAYKQLWMEPPPLPYFEEYSGNGKGQ